MIIRVRGRGGMLILIVTLRVGLRLRLRLFVGGCEGLFVGGGEGAGGEGEGEGAGDAGAVVQDKDWIGRRARGWTGIGLGCVNWWEDPSTK